MRKWCITVIFHQHHQEQKNSSMANKKNLEVRSTFTDWEISSQCNKRWPNKKIIPCSSQHINILQCQTSESELWIVIAMNGMVLELIKLLCTNTVVTRLSPASELVKTDLNYCKVFHTIRKSPRTISLKLQQIPLTYWSILEHFTSRVEDEFDNNCLIRVKNLINYVKF